jgi:hypothetical protein
MYKRWSPHDVPMQAQTGGGAVAPTRSQRGGLWSAPCSGRFTSGGDPVLIVQEAGWASGPVWTGVENLTPPGSDHWTVQLIARHYTDYAILATTCT